MNTTIVAHRFMCVCARPPNLSPLSLSFCTLEVVFFLRLKCAAILLFVHIELQLDSGARFNRCSFHKFVALYATNFIAVCKQIKDEPAHTHTHKTVDTAQQLISCKHCKSLFLRKICRCDIRRKMKCFSSENDEILRPSLVSQAKPKKDLCVFLSFILYVL